MLKITTVLALMGCIAAAYDGPALVSQNQNNFRSFGNLGQVSTFSKSIDTPFSSVRKADVRISNPSAVLASPSYTHLGYPTASIGYPGLVAQHHALPTITHAGYVRPATVATYQHPIATGGYGYASGLPAKTLVPAGAGLLGVAYSAAPSVSHMSFSNGLGLTYEW